ncbi:MAG: ABC transporter ATP-binding protein [Burkholderiales bacterium]
MAKLRVCGASKVFSVKGQQVEAFKGISFDVKEHQFVSIIGRSGCGKTTLLRIIAGLERTTAGKVFLNKNGEVREVSGPGPDRGMVFQEHYLFPWRTAKRNIEFGLERTVPDRAERDAIARKYLHLVNLERFGERYPSELSGGMRQRVAIARALATEPEILLLDEPFASLDALTRSFFQDELLRIWKVTQKTIILVTHSIDDAVYLSDRIIVLKPHPGEIREIIDHPLPRPRSKSSPEFARMVFLLEHLIGREGPAGDPELTQSLDPIGGVNHDHPDRR